MSNKKMLKEVHSREIERAGEMGMEGVRCRGKREKGGLVRCRIEKKGKEID